VSKVLILESLNLEEAGIGMGDGKTHCGTTAVASFCSELYRSFGLFFLSNGMGWSLYVF
jgi:hypothetical protein